MNGEDYLIWSHEHSAWWRSGGCGYTRRLSEAGRYSRDDAMQICIRAMPGTSVWLGALPELPVRAADAEALMQSYVSAFRRREDWM